MNQIEYTILRYVDSMATQEFANIGVFLLDRSEGTFHYQINHRYGRLSKFFLDFDGDHYRGAIKELDTSYAVLRRKLKEGDLFEAPPESVFEVVTKVIAGDSSCFQWSNAKSGIARVPQRRLEQLYDKFVLHNEKQHKRERRDEKAIWKDMIKAIQGAGLTADVDTKVEMHTDNFSYPFRVGWQNGTQQVAEPISFDLLRPSDILNKANAWGGRLYALNKENDFQFTAVVSAPEKESEQEAYENGREILSDAEAVRDVVEESSLDSVVADIETDIRLHG